jgi:hypothetical protein
MTHSAQISRSDNLALRKEIGERLGLSLNRMPAGMPPHLTRLMRQWREAPEQPSSEVTDRPGRPK